ncbi:putative permease YjgP/YjgQ family protein [Novipirellula aureliae]|uniref:Putative permease YjgP/YjgQ family protein n=1 Tax=Novipirellula aureliae TaxID=2527966 RepID=A0A5C6DG20_9BACT|nr:LptF/LptG family permease [Novipirellula aureliae]TWU35668.1 putative permease YjgP/YjgQ family protein [Novipirellula aureliae]
MMWLIRWFFAVRPLFRCSDECNPRDSLLIQQMAGRLEARDKVRRQASIQCTNARRAWHKDGRVETKGVGQISILGTIPLRITRDLITLFCVSLFVITTLVMFVGVAREAINQGLGPVGVMQLIPFSLPNALSLAVPGTALFSVCSVYGRMSADNELVAMQSVGISLLPAMVPAIVLTAIISIATVGLINVAFTWGFHGVQRVALSSVEKIAYNKLRRDHNFQHDCFSISVRDVQGRDLVEPKIKILRTGAEPVHITARTAQLTYRPDDESLQVSITSGKADIGGVASFHFPDTFVQTIPLGLESSHNLLTAHPSHMSMRDLPKASLRQSDDVRCRENEIAVRVGFSLLSSHLDEISDSDAIARDAGVEQSRKRVHRLDTEMNRRWASGFTCLAMSMIGIPLAIRMKTSDTMTTFGLVFLPTVLIYYPIFALTLDMAKGGQLFPQGVWIANLLFIVVSIMMMRRLVYQPA